MNSRTDFNVRKNKNEKLRYDLCYALREGAGKTRENFMKQEYYYIACTWLKGNIKENML